jgi:hypothetical protein
MFLIKSPVALKSTLIKLIARIVVYGKSITDSSASERDDVNTATPQTRFRSRTNPETGVQRYRYSNLREARCVMVENDELRKPLGSMIREGGDHR